MADPVNPEEIQEAMFKIVSDNAGLKKFKANDLTKAMIAQFGDDRVGKKDCKAAIRVLIDSGRLVYSYYGGSFIEIPHKEGAAND